MRAMGLCKPRLQFHRNTASTTAHPTAGASKKACPRGTRETGAHPASTLFPVITATTGRGKGLPRAGNVCVFKCVFLSSEFNTLAY